VDDVNIYVEEIVLDEASPLSPEHLHAALSRHVGDAGIQQSTFVARAIAESLRIRLGREPR
jgi:hypothetical protein